MWRGSGGNEWWRRNWRISTMAELVGFYGFSVRQAIVGTASICKKEQKILSRGNDKPCFRAKEKNNTDEYRWVQQKKGKKKRVDT